MHSIVLLDRATLAPGVRMRRPAFEHRWTEFERSEPADLPEPFAGASAEAQQAPTGRVIGSNECFAKDTPVNVVHGAF